MAGIKYTTKQELIDAFKALIFPNKKKLITGVNHQKSGLDLIESLWQEGNAGGCDEEVFTSTDNGATITLTRVTCGKSVTITGKITNDATAAAKRCDILNVIPVGYLGSSWFRLAKFVMVMDDEPTVGGNNGYLELDEVSSYSGGSVVPDKSVLQLAGQKKGVTRAYSIDGFNQFLGPNGSALADRVEDAETENYISASPLDITVKALNISYITAEQSILDGNTVSGVTSSEGVSISFVLTGDVL